MSVLRAARAIFGLPLRRLRPQGSFPTTLALAPKPVYDAFTRTYNFLGALVGVVLLSPLLLVLSLAVKLTSPGPALYRGARVGRGERVFSIYKFRTMKVDAEQKIGQRLVRQDEDHYTPIGRFLRKYRLDELAQLFNVLKGDMNLVGPRPLRPIFLKEHIDKIPGYALRFQVRPGITGQAQVRGGYYTSPRHKLFYEMLYLKHRTVLLDLKLILLTFVRVMTRIFTTAFLLTWLLAMAFLLPPNLQQVFVLNLGMTQVNALYLGPLLIGLFHVLRRAGTRSGRVHAFHTPVDLPLVGFVLVSALLIPLSRFPETAARGLAWYLCNGVVVFFLVVNSPLVKDQRDALVAALVGVVCLVGLQAFVEATRIGHSRLMGPNGPLALVAITVLTAPLALARARLAEQRWRRWLFGAATVLLITTALLTLSRSGILALTLALSLYLGRLGKARLLAVLLSFAMVLGVLSALGDARLQPTAALNDLAAVTQRQSEVLENLTAKRLLVGVGARTLPEHIRIAQRHGTAPSEVARQRAPSLENAYLTLLVDHGPLGFAFFLAFLFGGLFYMFRSARRVDDAHAKDDLWATASGLVGCAVLLFFSNDLYAFSMTIIFWASMGLGVGLAVQHQRGPKAVYRIIHYRQQL